MLLIQMTGEQTWTAARGGYCLCNDLGYTGEYNVDCDIVPGVTITIEGQFVMSRKD